MPNLRETCLEVMPLCTCRYSVRVTQPGEPGSALAGAAVRAIGLIIAARATRVKMNCAYGLSFVVVSLRVGARSLRSDSHGRPAVGQTVVLRAIWVSSARLSTYQPTSVSVVGDMLTVLLTYR